MSEEEKIKISVNEEDIQNLINCYKKDIEYIMQLEKENKELKERINKAIEYINSQSPDAGVSGKHIKEILKEVE